MLEKLQNKIKIKFNNPQLLKRALTHRSYLNENRQKELRSNERLEFLGDAVLELWATQHLFYLYPQKPEGKLTNIRSAIVCTQSLAEIANKLDLGEYLLLSKGESRGGGRKNPSLLADTFEAVVGAIYQDQDWETTSRFLDKQLLNKLKKIGEKQEVKDAKTKLQEIVQAKLKLTPHYKIIEESGPDHAKEFTAAVYYGQEKITEGEGRSKSEAENLAAKKALTKLV
jgi:ribonuclease-3